MEVCLPWKEISRKIEKFGKNKSGGLNRGEKS